MAIAAIIPALNEEKTITNVIRAIRDSHLVDEIIVVSDGSKDKTALLANRAGARVIELPETLGKGGAMTMAVQSTNAKILMFFDADLRGLRAEHVRSLLEPVQKGKADMCIGVTDRWRGMYKLNDAFRGSIPLVQLTGQRALKRFIFEEIPNELRAGFQIEEAMNYHCKVHGYMVKTVDLHGVHGVQKTIKYNFFHGLYSNFQMISQVLKIFFKVRILHLKRKM